MAKSLIELKTDLKSLKYQGVNGSEPPYVTKDINNPQSSSRAIQELFRRVDDTVRITKAVSPTNSRFLENQAKLLQASNEQKLNPVRSILDGSFIQRVATTAVSLAGVTTSTLAQVPLAGTGTRLGIGFKPTNGSVALTGRTLVAPLQLRISNLKDKQSQIRDLTVGGYVDSQGIKQLTPLEEVSQSSYSSTAPYTQLPSRALDYQAKSGTEIATGNLDEITKLKSQETNIANIDENNVRFTRELDSQGRIENNKAVAQVTLNDFRSTKPDTISFNYNSAAVNKELRLGLGNQGLPNRPKSVADLRVTRVESIDKINAFSPIDVNSDQIGTDQLDVDDLIKFRFRVLTPEKDTYIYFRAYLDSFNDSYQGNWSETEYIGRGERMQTYDGFSRNISLSFKIAASTRAEMKPLYQKIVYLASTTAPTYGGSSFMRGTLVSMTVGDYLFETPGVLTSIDYKWDTSYPWEISFLDDEMQQLPHILDCSIAFRPIHTFVPQTGLKPFITNPAAGTNFLV